LVAPPVVFLLFLGLGSLSYSAESVIGRVLLHRSAQNSPLVNALVPHQLAPWVIENRGALLLSVVLIVASGLIFRRLPPFEMALAYTVTALLLAWAVANQYLAIPMAAIAIGLNVGFLIWLALSTLYLGGDPAVLGIPLLTPVQKHVMLDYNWFAQDLFPWLLLGWILMVFALKRPGQHMLGVLPSQVSTTVAANERR
jgi:hypothetical protein